MEKSFSSLNVALPQEGQEDLIHRSEGFADFWGRFSWDVFFVCLASEIWLTLRKELASPKIDNRRIIRKTLVDMYPFMVLESAEVTV